jgi:hypothetical protein
MHDYFGEWYRTAGIPPESVPLAERWNAIEEYGPASADVALLTQLFFELTLSDASFPQTFRKALHDVDVTLPMRDNDNEMIVLAGAELINLIERGERELADFAALCLVCAGAQNLRRNPLVPDIPDRAAQYLKKRSEHREAFVKDSPQGKVFDGLTAAGGPYSDLAIEFRKLQLRFPLVDEETNMLWWLMGGTSGDLNRRWGELEVGAVCAIGAAELARLTRVLPGPIAARAFLDRAVRSERKKIPVSISIAEVVSGTPKEWREKYHQTPVVNRLTGLLPIHQAMTLSLQAQDNGAWRPVFNTSTKILATAKAAPDSVAYQIYLEHLTARSFAEMEEA